jgi:uncharacterized protein DUF6353
VTIAQTAKHINKVLVDNSPALLTALGVAGTVTTAYLTARAAVTASRWVEEAEQTEKYNYMKGSMDWEDVVRLTWKLYIPAAGVGLSTIMAIVMANRIGTRRTAAMVAAYSISENALIEYRDKVREKWGEKEEKEVRSSIAKDRVERARPEHVVVVSSGKQLCHEAYTGHFFESTMETIRRAENNINRQLMHENYATLSNFYNNVPGMKHTSISDEMGWNNDRFLEVTFDSILVEDEDSPYFGMTALSFDYAVVPIRNPWFLP